MEHAPGETDDQIFVWLPDRRVLMPGDNIYKAFPNLYTIRGTTHRDVLAWTASLDRMRDLAPAHLAPSHTRPVSGEAEVVQILTAYRDAIQFVHDQTVRLMNQGLTPDELVEAVRLPVHLRDHPYLREVYGTVEWSVRSVFAGYLGWFDGDAATLSPEPPAERASAYVELAGGDEAMLAAIRRALAERRHAWAAELAAHLRRARPDSAEARTLEADALRALARASISPNGRNYYLTQALELTGAAKISFEPTLDQGLREFLAELPVENFMAAMPVHLDPDRSEDTDMAVGFRFPDVDQSYGLHVRRGVAEFRRRLPENADVVVTADSRVWKEVVLGIRNPAAALLSGDVQVEGGTLDLVGFLRMFQT
jgi:alkyl sulfatase BDS1-like metallo-beta-lactamase superfamily hydrolase